MAVTLAVTLIHGCIEALPLASRLGTRDALAKWQCGVVARIVRFAHRRGAASGSFATVFRVHRRACGSLVAKDSFRVGVFKRPASDDNLIMGRALGLAILHQVDFSQPRIQPHVVELLNPSFRVHMRSVSEIAAALHPAAAISLLVTSWAW